EQFLGVRLIEVQAFGLAVRTVRAAGVRTLVPVEAEPAEIEGDRVFRLAARSLDVGVLDPQNEDPRRVFGGATGQQPVEQRGPRVADMKLPRGAGSESDSHYTGLRP